MSATSVRNVVVLVQMATFITLAILFWRTGAPRLAAAQLCYAVATAVLFLGVK